MKKKLVVPLFCAVLALGAVGCSNTEKGAVGGALGGAAIGGAVGGGEGALIGGALGAGAGALIGSQIHDDRRYHHRYGHYRGW